MFSLYFSSCGDPSLISNCDTWNEVT